MAENSSLVSNKSHALGLDRHNNMATSEDFSSYFVLEVYSNVCVIIFIFYIYLQKNSHMMYSLRFYILFKILKFLYQRILRFFSSKREKDGKKKRKREKDLSIIHIACMLKLIEMEMTILFSTFRYKKLLILTTRHRKLTIINKSWHGQDKNDDWRSQYLIMVEAFSMKLVCCG